MSVYLDESLVVRGTSGDAAGVSLERLVKELGERINPGGQGAESDRRRVDEIRLKLLEVSVELFPYGTVVFGPEHELADKQHAAIQFTDERRR